MNQPTGKDTAYLLQKPVSIPSVNPAFCAPDENPEIFGKQRVAHFLGEFFQQIGCKVWLRMEQTPPKSRLPEHRVWSSALATLPKLTKVTNGFTCLKWNWRPRL